MIGRTISHYRIVSQLGAGGMGVVYRAEDLRLGRAVALKFLPEQVAKDHQSVERLRIEARAASALNHANICTIYDIDESDGRPFIAMELIKGQTLRERLATGPLKTHFLVDIGIQIADALDASHSQGIIHRDIKPANIFLTERDQVKLVDFGLAKLTAREASPTTTAQPPRDQLTGEGVTLGTVSYMSPEQATGEELDARTDLFSLGVVLYECATGHPPFTGKTSGAILAAIIGRAHLSPMSFNSEIPVRLQEVINNALEKDRELRYQSAADVRADLKRVKRDLDSGRLEIVSGTGRGSRGTTAAAAARQTPPERTQVINPPVVETRPASGPQQTESGSRRMIPIAAAAAVVAVALLAYFFWPRAASQLPAGTNSLAALSDATVRSRRDLAAQSLEARNYRAALAYASEVLAVAPDDPTALKVRDDSRAMLARFDAALENTRQRAAAGDLSGAAQALEAARAIDPTSPTVTELSARLADQLKNQPPAASAPRGRAAAPAPAPPPPSPAESARAEIPRPPAASTQAAPAPQTQVPPIPAPGADVTPSPAPPRAQPPAPAAPQAAPEPDVVTPPPAPAPAPAAQPSRTPPPAAVEDDEAAIRRVVATYGRAIENKDLALFRTVKPNLSREEERRLTEGFRNVVSQRVELTILSVGRQNQSATVQVRRRDVIQTGRQQQTAESRQTFALERANGGWVIVEIR